MADDEHHALGPLGLSARAEDVYRTLLSLPRSDVPTLADHLGLSAEVVGEIIPGLLGNGLAKMVADGCYAANPPQLSIVALLGERFESLNRAYSAVGQLERTFRQTRCEEFDTSRTETVGGLDAIHSRLRQLTAGARHEVRLFMRYPLITSDDAREPGPDHTARFRSLYEKALLDDSAVVEMIRRSAGQGHLVRFAATLPVKLAIADDERALIMRPGTRPVALLTEHPALLAMAMGLFEQVWATAVPAPAMGAAALSGLGDTDCPGDPHDRLLLSLLLAGLTDQTIAAKLGVGLRTVQRRVRDLMDAANVDTRIQLGWQASRKGWV